MFIADWSGLLDNFLLFNDLKVGKLPTNLDVDFPLGFLKVLGFRC